MSFSLPLVLGTLGFGSFIDEKTSFSVLDAYWDGGGRVVDLAQSYGQGAARVIVARHILARKRPFAIWDKVGMKYRVNQEGIGSVAIDFSNPQHYSTYIQKFVSEIGYSIECLQLHAPIPDAYKQRVFEWILNMQSAGFVRHIGISNHSSGETEAIAAYATRVGIRVFSSQAHLNVLEQRAVREILPVNFRLGINTWANRVLARGALYPGAGTTARQLTSPRLREYEKTERDAISRVHTIAKGLAPHNPLSLILNWPLSCLSVQGVIVGASSASQVESVIEAIQENPDPTTLQVFGETMSLDKKLNVAMRPSSVFDTTY